MNDLESQLATVRELVALAGQRGVDLSSICHNWAFLKDGRFISIWRKEGKVHCNLQGPIDTLPETYKASASAYRGMWHEAVMLTDLEEAFGFLSAWLIDRKEVDDLPRRFVRREGIG